MSYLLDQYDGLLFWTQKALNEQIKDMEDASTHRPKTFKTFKLTVRKNNNHLIGHPIQSDCGAVPHTPKQNDWKAIPVVPWPGDLGEITDCEFDCSYNTSYQFHQTGNTLKLQLTIKKGTLIFNSSETEQQHKKINGSVFECEFPLKIANIPQDESIIIPTNLKNTMPSFPDTHYNLKYIGLDIANEPSAINITLNSSLVSSQDQSIVTAFFRATMLTYLRFLRVNCNPFILTYMVLGKKGQSYNYPNSPWENVPQPLIPINFRCGLVHDNNNNGLSTLCIGIQTLDGYTSIPDSFDVGRIIPLRQYNDDGGLIYRFNALLNQSIVKNIAEGINQTIVDAIKTIANNFDKDNFPYPPFSSKRKVSSVGRGMEVDYVIAKNDNVVGLNGATYDYHHSFIGLFHFIAPQYSIESEFYSGDIKFNYRSGQENWGVHIGYKIVFHICDGGTSDHNKENLIWLGRNFGLLFQDYDVPHIKKTSLEVKINHALKAYADNMQKGTGQVKTSFILPSGKNFVSKHLTLIGTDANGGNISFELEIK